MNLTRAVLFIAVLALSASANAEDSPACREAVAKIDAFFAAQKHDCKADADCDGYYFRPGICASVVVLPKAVVTDAFTKDLLAQQAAARAACAAEWGTSPACAPIPFHAVCANGTCIDGMNTPPAAPTPE